MRKVKVFFYTGLKLRDKIVLLLTAALFITHMYILLFSILVFITIC